MMTPDVAPTLHEVLVAFQKSLSRARERTQQVVATEVGSPGTELEFAL